MATVARAYELNMSSTSPAISADDLVGRIQVPLVDLMLKPNEVHKRTDGLMGFEGMLDSEIMCPFF